MNDIWVQVPQNKRLTPTALRVTWAGMPTVWEVPAALVGNEALVRLEDLLVLAGVLDFERRRQAAEQD